jgi:hypothetical protein
MMARASQPMTVVRIAFPVSKSRAWRTATTPATSSQKYTTS